MAFNRSICGKTKEEYHKPLGREKNKAPDYEFQPQASRVARRHAARRGLGAILYRLGVPQKTVQAIFRHANVSTTNTYWIKSATDNTRAAVADLISDLLSHYGFWGYSLVLLELCRCSDGIWSGNELL